VKGVQNLIIFFIIVLTVWGAVVNLDKIYIYAYVFALQITCILSGVAIQREANLYFTQFLGTNPSFLKRLYLAPARGGVIFMIIGFGFYGFFQGLKSFMWHFV
jgi:hypothetical protein